jgi:hypothetical protein
MKFVTSGYQGKYTMQTSITAMQASTAATTANIVNLQAGSAATQASIVTMQASINNSTDLKAGWIPPEHGPTSALNGVAMLLNHEMDEVLESVDRKRRSDSFPIQPPPHDTESTELNCMEEDEIIRFRV